jgi:hypothetical protein
MADLTITAASVLKSASAGQTAGIAGAAITQGQLLYVDTTDSNKMKLADADASASSFVSGVALTAAAAGQPVVYLTTGQYTVGATVAVGAAYYVSTTAGAICLESDLSTGDFATFIGFGVSTTQIDFRPLPSGVAKA